MDSVTQIALGAAVGEAVLGKKVGNKAILWGGLSGLIPDLDVLASPFLSDVERLVFHRSVTHSIVFAIAMAPLLALLARKLHKDRDASLREWSLLFFLGLFTHALLDAFTNYGTQLFWPFSRYAVAFNTIFIIDPLYTLPLLFGVIIAACLRRTGSARRMANNIGLGLSTFYLMLTVSNKFYVDHQFESALRQQNIAFSRFFSNPTPINNVLWRCVAESADGYWEGLYSLLDDGEDISFRLISKNHDLLRPYKNNEEIQLLIAASKGFYTVSKEGGHLYFNDLRFGKTDLGILPQGEYIFSYAIKPQSETLAIQRRIPDIRITKKVLLVLLERISGDHDLRFNRL